MFGLLKKKISSFIDTLTQKEEAKPDEPEKNAENLTEQKLQTPAPRQPIVQKPVPQASSPSPQTQRPEPVAHTKTEIIPSAPVKTETHVFPVQPKPQATATTKTPPTAETKPKGLVSSIKDALFSPKPDPVSVEPNVVAEPKKVQPDPNPSPVFQTLHSKDVSVDEKQQEKQITRTELTPKSKPPTSTTKEPAQANKAAPLIEAPKERKLEAKIGIVSQIKGIFTRDVQIQPTELDPMLDELNMALLESDVTLDTAEHIVATIKTQLSGRHVDKSKVQAEIQAAVKTALIDVLDKPPLDLVGFIHDHDKPVKILLLGPNGAGKTTTLAKMAHYLKQNDIRCVLAAADTFRAAAIEQLQHHGSAIGVPVIHHQYGADPAAVAFDAIAHAKAHGLDVVLIDTAGRQETNLNLLKEMEKINRVVQPDLKLFIGEAVAGHALVEQAKTFHSSLKLDGVILTKVDCDAKGGTSFSVSHEVGVPIVLLGTGQAYNDIRPFDAKWLVANVLAE